MQPLSAAHCSTRRRLPLEQLPLEPRAAAAEIAETQRAQAQLTEAETCLLTEAEEPDLQADKAPPTPGGAAGWRSWLARSEAQVSHASQRRLRRFEQRAAEAQLQQAAAGPDLPWARALDWPSWP